MFIDQFLSPFNLDVQLEDASIDPGSSVSRRVLASLCLGTDPGQAYRAASRVLEVLIGLSQGRAALPALIMMLEDGGADLERAIYFAQAGRGIGTALADLDWLLPILAVRAQLRDDLDERRLPVLMTARAFSRPEIGLRLKVDVTRTAYASSLTYWGEREAPVSDLDVPLFGLSLDAKSHPLLRVLAGLCVGVGLDDAFYSTRQLLEGMEAFWKDGRYAGSQLSVMLANDCDDLQRALFFATVGRSRPLIKQVFLTLLDALKRRVEIWQEKAGGDEGGVHLMSPYVIMGRPEACVFVADVVPGQDAVSLLRQG